MPSSPLWTKTELEIVSTLYSEFGAVRLHKEFLQTRSPDAIQLKAKALGIKFQRQYIDKTCVIPKLNSGIYKLVFQCGKYYIGKAKRLGQREGQHRRRGSFSDLGSFTFEVIHRCVVEDLAYFESKYISESIKDPKCLNLQVPKA